MSAKSFLSCLTLGDPMEPTRLFCPLDFPGKNTGVGYHVLLQGIFLTQGSNLHLLQVLYQVASLSLSHRESPLKHLELGNSLLEVGVCPVHCMMLSVFPGLCP